MGLLQLIKIKSLTKSEKIGLARKGNIEKYNSYSEAFKRIKESLCILGKLI